MKAQKTDIWMPFYPGDYLSDTLHLNTLQHGAYFLLILAYWKNVGPLPDDDDRLSSITKLSKIDWKHNRPILQEFFDLTIIPGEWVHERIDKELLKAFDQKQKASDRGKKGAKGRWG